MAKDTVSNEGTYIQNYLKGVGIPEGTYDALRKSDIISFMPRRIKGQVGFSHEQLIALKAFWLLRTYGLSRRTAAEAVEAAFPTMKEFAETGKLSHAAYKVGVRIISSKGKLGFVPIALASHETADLGRVEFDIRAISLLVRGTVPDAPT